MTILPNQPEADYHAHPAVSRSYLYTMYKQTPYHAKHMAPIESKTMDLGSATHVAILQPELFDTQVIRGAEDRRGNKWKDIVTANPDKIVLTFDDHDKCMYMRDAAHRLSVVRELTKGTKQIENSAYWIDEETGIDCRCRADIYHPQLKLLADLKTVRSAAQYQFSSSIAEYGYHVQEAMYSEGWPKAGGGEVDGFFFILVENEWPHCAALREIVPSAVEEGVAVYRKALAMELECRKAGDYPAYSTHIEPTDIPGFAYKETMKPMR